LTFSARVQRLRVRLRDRESLLHAAVVVLKTTAVNHGLLILSSILLIRYVSKSEYGLWRVLASTTAIAGVLSGGFDQAIVRFLPLASEKDANAAVLSSFAAKAVVTGLCLAALLGAYPWLSDWLNVPSGLSSDFKHLFWILVASTVLSTVETTVFTVAAARKQFGPVYQASVAKQVMVFVGLLIVLQLRLSLAVFLLWELFISVPQLIWLWRTTRSVTGSGGGDLWSAIRRADRWQLMRHGWRVHLRHYAVPLNISSALSYVRGHLPVILLGSRVSLESAAIYAILRNVLMTLHKLEGGVVAGVFPKVFELYETNRAGFIAKFNNYAGLSYALRGAVGLALLAGAPLMLWVYEIEPTPEIYLVLAILVLEFLMTEVANVSQLVVLLADDTRRLMVSAALRFVCEAAMLVFVTARFGLLGAAITLFVSRTVETISTVHASNRVFAIKYQYAALGVVAGAFVLVTAFGM
jgi:O-antigen/teichoic acid export membrane protein